jgi:carbon-monoxide dehydrogenase medium subunit
MRTFEYVQLPTAQDTALFLAEHPDDSLALAGGTAAVVLMKLGVLRPAYVVDLGGLDELRGVDVAADGTLRLGALTTLRSVERDPKIADGHALLAEAAGQVANVRVRNVATVGGTVAYGEPQTDTPVALIASGASVTIAGTSGPRTVAMVDFYRGPYDTVLEEGEIVTSVVVPPSTSGSAGCHLKFTVGSPENKPVANVSASLTIDSATGACSDARVVMGAVGPVPVVASAASRLVGETLAATLIAEVAQAASDEADPYDDVRGPAWYKRRICRVLVERALTSALAKAKDGR